MAKRALIALLVGEFALAMQSAPKFEVASVKPGAGCGDAGGRGGGGGAGTGNSVGRVDLRCMTVMDLVRMAYVRFANGRRNPNPIPISGGPAWINSDRFDIDAKAEGPQTMEMLRGPMLQALLEERFQLKIRRETTEIPVYALTVASGGPKLRASAKGSCAVLEPGRMPPETEPGRSPIRLGGPFYATNGGVDTYGQTMEGLCRQFMVHLNRPCVDRTGITGTFDIHLDLSEGDLFPAGPPSDTPAAPDATAAAADPVGSILAAVRKLGLKLEAAKGPGEFLVIDRVERPSAN